MKAIKKLLLGATAIFALSGCTFTYEASWIPPTYDDFKEDAEWEILESGYKDLEYQSNKEYDDGWKYHFNYEATKYGKTYELSVTSKGDRDDRDNDGDYHEIKSIIENSYRID